jgi:hypothetical protein
LGPHIAGAGAGNAGGECDDDRDDGGGHLATIDDSDLPRAKAIGKLSLKCSFAAAATFTDEGNLRKGSERLNP